MMGDEGEIWNLSHLIIEHYGLWKITKEIHETIDALNRTDEKDEAKDRLIKRLSVKIQLFGGFLSHHMEMEEKVLFPIALTTMSEAEILHAHRLMKVVETWPSDF
jgi:hemerythrin-like domain-containing protein